MKKHELNKQKNKLKKRNDFKLIRYAKNMSVVMIVLFLVYVSLLSMTTQGGMAALFNSNLFVTVGFIVCTANLYIWQEMKKILADLNSYENIESSKVKLILIAVAELVLFNYATVALIVLALVRYFKWRNISIKQLYLEIKKTCQRSAVTICASVLVSFVTLSYFIVMTAMTI